MGETWTIGELAERAAGLLGSERRVNGRVRDVPNERLIRWYATIGLLDPPLARRGRVAQYGRRHLLQLVAVKRLQAEGLSIAAIQVELAGATDMMLQRAARLPDMPDGASAASTPPQETRRERFWTRPATDETPAETPAAAISPAPTRVRGPMPADALGAGLGTTGANERRFRDDSEENATFGAATRTVAAEEPSADAVAADTSAADTSTPCAGTPETAAPGTNIPDTRYSASNSSATNISATKTTSAHLAPADVVYGVRLAPGVTVSLGTAGRTVTPAEVRALREAAEPLLSMLAQLGLTDRPDPAEGMPR
jgi:DNA-binding transcriptional MerR regulator